jgi:catechol 2,3-dioxygenase-like lactoylglutathione lyase family enzyme
MKSASGAGGLIVLVSGGKSEGAMIEVERAIPTMFVSDLDAACAWYERVLGFRTTFRHTDYAGLSLGGASIHLGQYDPPITAAFYLRLTSGVDELVASIEAKGERLCSPLKDQDYGMREATIHDPDGNEIYLGQPLPPCVGVLDPTL